MENNIFDSTRFLNYLRSYILINRRQLLITLALFVAIPVALPSVMAYLDNAYMRKSFIYVDPMWHTEMVVFNLIFVIWAAVFGSKIYGNMQSKGNRIEVLTNPASQFEKFLAYFFIYVVCFYVLYVAVTFLGDYVRVIVTRMYAEEGAIIKPIPLEYVLTLGNCDDILAITEDRWVIEGATETTKLALIRLVEFKEIAEPLMLVNTIVLTQAFFALGGIVWFKNVAMKTASFGIAMMIIVAIVWGLGFKTFIGGPFEPRFEMSIANTTALWIIECVVFAMTVFFYWLSYKRFKEAEIIHRW